MTLAKFIQLYDLDSPAVQDSLRQELSSGLLEPQAALSPKFLYDALGSRIFDAITELTEYYPTRTEAAIFQTHAPQLAQLAPQGAALIDLGAGSCEKASRLFSTLKPAHYVPIDISVDYLRGTLECLQREHPSIRMTGVGMDFSSQLALPAALAQDIAGLPVIVFYPGSSIGNFAPDAAHALLSQAHALCKDTQGGLLIGVDLVKGKDVLEPAYDDALGVTASFNLNMLLNVNRILGSDFDVRDWQHRALFNSQDSRIEMHLHAKRDITVTWLGASRSFKAGQSIHTENSYKWTLPGFSALLQSAGFAAPASFTDAAQMFSVHWAAS
jgi:L-histidine Nalpha-methyltransferase